MTTGFIFLALAIAWAAYLIPKAMAHHEAAERTRAVEQLAESSRVVARREAVDASSAVLVSGDYAAGAAPPELLLARRAAMRRATARRRRVLMLLVVAAAVVIGLAAFGVVDWRWTGVPAGLLAAWLMACRFTVNSERRAWESLTVAEGEEDLTMEVPLTPYAEDGSVADGSGGTGGNGGTAAQSGADAGSETGSDDEPADGLWEPVAVTLPTYVDAPVARRVVQPIDLESTGVWTSGRTREASEIAREAEAFRAAAEAAEAETSEQRAVGS